MQPFLRYIMKNLLIVTILLLVFSCKDKSANEIKSQNENVISSVESKSFTRYSKGSSLIDEIYFELIKNDESLKMLDDKINLINKNSNELITQKEKILEKPTEYFDDVNSNIKNLTDSLLKKEMQNFVKLSLENFNKKKEELRLIVTQIQRNKRKITEFYDAFKIKKTLPEIEKYQKQNPLNLNDLDKLISEQNHLLDKLKNLK